jgi:hypothetical protein
MLSFTNSIYNSAKFWLLVTTCIVNYLNSFQNIKLKIKRVKVDLSLMQHAMQMCKAVAVQFDASLMQALDGSGQIHVLATSSPVKEP